MNKDLNRASWLERLEPIRYDEKKELEEDQLEQMNLASALFALSDINHDTEHKLCHKLAEHLMGKAKEPDDEDLEEE